MQILDSMGVKKDSRGEFAKQGYLEILRWSLYSTKSIHPDIQTARFFDIPLSSYNPLSETNLEMGCKLPDPCQFLATGLTITFETRRPDLIRPNCIVEFLVGDKIYFRNKLSLLSSKYDEKLQLLTFWDILDDIFIQQGAHFHGRLIEANKAENMVVATMSITGLIGRPIC